MQPVPLDQDVLNRRPAFDQRELALWPALLLAAWIVAWLIDLHLRNAFNWGDTADTANWVAIKIALWVLPVVMILRKKKLPLADYVGLRTPLQGLAIGALAGLGLLAFSYAMDAVLGGASFTIPVLDAALFNGVIVAPLVEEFTMRGFYLESLERQAKTLAGRKFADANILQKKSPDGNVLQGIVFVALHLPGWYFQGRLRSPLSVIQPAVFLWLLAMLLGWLKKQSNSLYAPIVVHVLNNLYSAARG
jgi:membrane protease YdiL (CAAX protease family)